MKFGKYINEVLVGLSPEERSELAKLKIRRRAYRKKVAKGEIDIERDSNFGILRWDGITSDEMERLLDLERKRYYLKRKIGMTPADYARGAGLDKYSHRNFRRHINKKSYSTKYKVLKYTFFDQSVVSREEINTLAEKFPWLTEATFKNAKIEYSNELDSMVLNATWIDGTWTGEGGLVFTGTWKNGNWQEGIFYKGTWERGDWESGLFLESKWKKGFFHAGSFSNSVWFNGEWTEKKREEDNRIFAESDWRGGKWYGSPEEWIDSTINGKKSEFPPDSF